MLCGGYLRESNPLSTRVFRPAAVLREPPRKETVEKMTFSAPPQGEVYLRGRLAEPAR